MDKLIYCQKQDGSFVKVGEPRGNPNRDNFLISLSRNGLVGLQNSCWL